MKMVSLKEIELAHDGVHHVRQLIDAELKDFCREHPGVRPDAITFHAVSLNLRPEDPAAVTVTSTVLILRAEDEMRRLQAQGKWADVEYRSEPWRRGPICHVRLTWGEMLPRYGGREKAIAYKEFYEDGTARVFSRL